ncbi:hypothetical protein FIBSPDRAFT_863843 [Athelia psychrophila]|uniref:Uncharacterized protein n=1 Tax=Athelia psychrophila TaxID=1759441 RepID=A0A166H0R9_9AGAM|nr:hypothetical protein FIBSPDRAFT_863843 [Fibularhizoctonia sp. CBS 109695]
MVQYQCSHRVRSSPPRAPASALATPLPQHCTDAMPSAPTAASTSTGPAAVVDVAETVALSAPQPPTSPPSSRPTCARNRCAHRGSSRDLATCVCPTHEATRAHETYCNDAQARSARIPNPTQPSARLITPVSRRAYCRAHASQSRRSAGDTKGPAFL